MPTYMVQGKLVTLTAVRADVGGDPVAVTPIEKFRDSDRVWINGIAASQLGAQLCTPNGRLPLSPLEAVPATLSLPGDGILRVQNDRPMPRRALTNMAFHDFVYLSRRARLRSQPDPRSRLSSYGPHHGDSRNDRDGPLRVTNCDANWDTPSMRAIRSKARLSPNP